MYTNSIIKIHRKFGKKPIYEIILTFFPSGKCYGKVVSWHGEISNGGGQTIVAFLRSLTRFLKLCLKK